MPSRKSYTELRVQRCSLPRYNEKASHRGGFFRFVELGFVFETLLFLHYRRRHSITILYKGQLLVNDVWRRWSDDCMRSREITSPKSFVSSPKSFQPKACNNRRRLAIEFRQIQGISCRQADFHRRGSKQFFQAYHIP